MCLCSFYLSQLFVLFILFFLNFQKIKINFFQVPSRFDWSWGNLMDQWFIFNSIDRSWPNYRENGKKGVFKGFKSCSHLLDYKITVKRNYTKLYKLNYTQSNNGADFFIERKRAFHIIYSLFTVEKDVCNISIIIYFFLFPQSLFQAGQLLEAFLWIIRNPVSFSWILLLATILYKSVKTKT